MTSFDDITIAATYAGTGQGDDDWQREANCWDVIVTFGERGTHQLRYWMGLGLVNYRPAYRPDGTMSVWRLKPNEQPVYNHYGPGKDAISTPREPTRAEVLCSLASDAGFGDVPFDEFCGDLGYDTDSRKAYATWQQCVDIRFRLRALLGGRLDEFMQHDWDAEITMEGEPT